MYTLGDRLHTNVWSKFIVNFASGASSIFSYITLGARIKKNKTLGAVLLKYCTTGVTGLIQFFSTSEIKIQACSTWHELVGQYCHDWTSDSVTVLFLSYLYACSPLNSASFFINYDSFEGLVWIWETTKKIFPHN